ncbi:hypothetical protein [Sphingomonas sp. 28-62-11]
MIALVAITEPTIDRVREFLAVDSCLDSGGRWDEKRQRCDHGA